MASCSSLLCSRDDRPYSSSSGTACATVGPTGASSHWPPAAWTSSFLRCTIATRRRCTSTTRLSTCCGAVECTERRVAPRSGRFSGGPSRSPTCCVNTTRSRRRTTSRAPGRSAERICCGGTSAACSGTSLGTSESRRRVSCCQRTSARGRARVPSSPTRSGSGSLRTRAVGVASACSGRRWIPPLTRHFSHALVLCSATWSGRC
mmetsp:Transcript_98948/g.279553  ORF Transcript_98948/g.279553 Transcript_98948/m.279553 type:complete len:205 (-) Transcript_98948:1200-1814(-)